MVSKHSSKGNQIKYRRGDTWYKADFLGYEGAAELVSSWLLENSAITNFAKYSLCSIGTGSQACAGCKSMNFLNHGETLVTLQRLFLAEFGKGVEQCLAGLSLEKKIQKLIELTESVTGLNNFRQYLLETLTLDMLILNEDRHWHNLAVIKTASGYRVCPIFDNGAAFLSDTEHDYPLCKDAFGLISNVEAKPFSKGFEKQVSTCESVVGRRVLFTAPEELPESLLNDLGLFYANDVCNRIAEVYKHQRYLYGEYFVKEKLNKVKSFV